jgi:hypothetical protein
MNYREGQLTDGYTEDIESQDVWLGNARNSFEQHANLATEDLVRATETLISLLYQSVSIRDSRHSISLTVSSMYFLTNLQSS